MFRSVKAFVILTLLALMALPLSAMGQATGSKKKETTAGAKQRPGSGRHYGATPADIVPYRGFKDPYKLNFAEEQPFLGTGRDKKAPADLRTVRIGFLGPLEDKSPEAPMGHRMLKGAQLALEEANAKGGYKGLPFEMVIRDDVGPWGSASNKYMELYDEKVWAVLGSVDGQSTHIALRVALKVELPFVTSGSTDPTLTETRIPWYLRVNADDRQESYALANYIFKVKGYKRVSALRVNSRYGRVGIGEFRDSARRLGRPLLLEMRYGPGDKDFSSQIARIKQGNPEAVVLWGDAQELADIIKQMRGAGMKQPIFTCDRLVSPEFVKAAGNAAEGVVAAYPFDPSRTDAKWQSFRQRYIKRFKEEPDWQASHAFDGMNIIIDAIRAKGMNRTLIRDYISGLTEYEGVTGHIPFDATLNDVGPIYLARMQGGKFTYFPAPAKN